MHSLWEHSAAKRMIFMKHRPIRTSVNRYQIIEYALLQNLSVQSALSCEASDRGWMNVPSMF